MHPTLSGSNPNALLMKSGEDQGERMEEKRGRRWRGLGDIYRGEEWVETS